MGTRSSSSPCRHRSGIRGGSPEDWPQYHAERLAPEEIYPVCSAGYLAQHPPPAQAADLLAHQLIHLEEPFRAAATWGEWFAAVGIAAGGRIEHQQGPPRHCGARLRR